MVTTLDNEPRWGSCMKACCQVQLLLIKIGNDKTCEVCIRLTIRLTIASFEHSNFYSVSHSQRLITSESEKLTASEFA